MEKEDSCHILFFHKRFLMTAHIATDLDDIFKGYAVRVLQFIDVSFI